MRPLSGLLSRLQVAVLGSTDDWPAKASLTRESFLARFGEVPWQPQYLLPGNVTRLAPYLRRAALGGESRPTSFNRPTDLHTLRMLQAEVRWPSSFAHPSLMSSGNGAAGLDFFVGPNGSGLPQVRCVARLPRTSHRPLRAH